MLQRFALYWASGKIYRKPHPRSLVKGFVKMSENNYVIKEDPSKHETLNQCWADVGPALQTLVNISPAFVQCLMFAGTALSQAVTHPGEGPQQIRDIDHVLVQCRPIVSDAGSTLKQHKSNVTYLLEDAMAPIAVLLYSWWGVTDLIVCIHTPTPNPPLPQQPAIVVICSAKVVSAHS